jgi:hypothetical protein
VKIGKETATMDIFSELVWTLYAASVVPPQLKKIQAAITNEVIERAEKKAREGDKWVREILAIVDRLPAEKMSFREGWSGVNSREHWVQIQLPCGGWAGPGNSMNDAVMHCNNPGLCTRSMGPFRVY